MIRPISCSPILPILFEGEYHVNSVRTPGSMATARTKPSACVSRDGAFCVSYTQANFQSFVFQEYVTLQSLVILCVPSSLVGHLFFLRFVSKCSDQSGCLLTCGTRDL